MFKAGKFKVLVATDIAARGIDVTALSHVINYDVPVTPEDYIHRVGRTARASMTGDAFTLVAPDEESDLRAIEHTLGKRLPRITLPEFDYNGPPDSMKGRGPLERNHRGPPSRGSGPRAGGHRRGGPPQGGRSVGTGAARYPSRGAGPRPGPRTHAPTRTSAARPHAPARPLPVTQIPAAKPYAAPKGSARHLPRPQQRNERSGPFGDGVERR
jgi:ATP-dependent RNA helicase RhlE